SWSRSRAGTERNRGFSAAAVAPASSHLSWPSSKAMYRVPVVVVIMFPTPSSRIKVSYLTKTCTASDTLLKTWYRTMKFSTPNNQEEDSLLWFVELVLGLRKWFELHLDVKAFEKHQSPWVSHTLRDRVALLGGVQPPVHRHGLVLLVQRDFGDLDTVAIGRLS